MEQRINTLLEWIKRGKAPPLTIEVWLTDRCNLKCRVCDRIKKLDLSEEVSKDRLLQLVKEAAGLGVKQFKLLGRGEPCLRSCEFIEIACLVKKYGMQGYTVTNGSLLSEEQIKLLVLHKWDEFCISLDSAYPEVHDFLRRKKGLFQTVMKNIDLFNKWKVKLNHEKPILTFNTLITNKVYNKLDKLIYLAYEKKIKRISFIAMLVHSKEGEKLALSEKQKESFQKNIPLVQELAEKLGVETNICEFKDGSIVDKSQTIMMDDLLKEEISKIQTLLKKNPFISATCFLPWYHLTIGARGQTTPCCKSLEEKDLDNVKSKTLKDIWFGQKLTEFRKTILNSKTFNFCPWCASSVFIDTKKERAELIKRLVN